VLFDFRILVLEYEILVPYCTEHQDHDLNAVFFQPLGARSLPGVFVPSSQTPKLQWSTKNATGLTVPFIAT
jgi:hypothetical protein